ncbi:MAG: bifunctional diaminohydroxyphosphoribosylaminopyrimidine deaminase/5-amino-6-(5-phosphoribosylamino)uracil reductase RibD [Candidatus Marinimicrobia bacterium]|nr:bifunctional diaminohydroxyphosphoribosylaminopyrimidine deaminase/5-amino-6-(5-phosphoribosylamino)uracil reductase RibD [Candidatus Neomarinimicrobiota bacterium]
MNDENKYMKKAIELAKRGIGGVSPNPAVGAVIVKDDKIIGEGFHNYFGGKHAEVEAIENATESVIDSTMFVTLEPCNHYGKTPPCTEQIIKEKIKKVIIAMKDPNPQMSGESIKILQENRIEVKIGILESDARKINQPYTKATKFKLPYIILKSALSLDGFIADSNGDSKWISNAKSRKLVHKWRADYDAVMVGIGTVLKDDPMLNVREVSGKNPTRIIYDSSASLIDKLQITKTANEIKTIVITNKILSQKYKKMCEVNEIEILEMKNSDGKELQRILKILAKKNIQSIMVEGGGKLQSLLIENDLVDRIDLFYSSKVFGNGVPMMKFKKNKVKNSEIFKKINWEIIDDNVLFTGIINEY